MQLHQVRYFIETVEQRHFRRSAAKLGISQPALSRGIQALERELGGVLIEKRRTRMHLSQLGRLVLPELRLAMSLIDQAKANADAFIGTDHRTVSLVVSEDAQHLLYTPALDEVVRTAGAARVTVEVRSQAMAVQGLLEGQFDIGLLGEDDLPFETTDYGGSPLVVAFPPERDAPPGPVTYDALRDEAFIVRDGKSYEAAFTTAMAQAGCDRAIKHRANEDRSLLLMFRANLGCLLLPKAQADAFGLEYRSLAGDAEARVVVAVPSRLAKCPEHAQVLEALLRERMPTQFPQKQTRQPASWPDLAIAS